MTDAAHGEEADFLRLHDAQACLFGQFWASMTGQYDRPKSVLAASNRLAVEWCANVTLRDEFCDKMGRDDTALRLTRASVS